MSGPTLGREFRVLNQRAAQPSVLEDLSCTPWHATLHTRAPVDRISVRPHVPDTA